MVIMVLQGKIFFSVFISFIWLFHIFSFLLPITALPLFIVHFLIKLYLFFIIIFLPAVPPKHTSTRRNHVHKMVPYIQVNRIGEQEQEEEEEDTWGHRKGQTLTLIITPTIILILPLVLANNL